jgi:pimeloyl-ACP methyl ester carboxylesterase
VLATALAILLAAAPASPAKVPLRACAVQGVPAKCGTLLVPENRDTGFGPRIGLRIVVVPARRKPARSHAFTYLAGGPGAAATEHTAAVNSIWSGVHERHDILLVDQRGTGGSHPLACPPPEESPDVGIMIKACLASLNGDPTQYGSAAAADDLESVRAALGYRTLDLYGVSYGATLAQVYLARHPRSVRTVTLDGATLLDVPFWDRFAVNGQRALDLTARRCAREPACARAFPSWPAQLRSLIEAWNAKPVRVTSELTLSGDDLAGLIQSMTLNAASAASIPLVVSRAARGDHAPLVGQIPSSGAENPLMYWSIWCNESWVGLDASGPWGTYLDGYVASQLDRYRSVCAYVPDHAEPASNLARVRSNIPALALVGGADPQDPAGNIAGLGSAMPKARVVVLPEHGHAVGQYGCLPSLVSRFVERGSAATLDVRCVRTTKPAPFALG